MLNITKEDNLHFHIRGNIAIIITVLKKLIEVFIVNFFNTQFI